MCAGVMPVLTVFGLGAGDAAGRRGAGTQALAPHTQLLVRQTTLLLQLTLRGEDV